MLSFTFMNEYSPLLADHLAGTAALAALRSDHDLWQRALTFGIMTPGAVERTTLEKNGSPNTGPVMYGKTLYIEDYSLLHATRPPSTNALFEWWQPIPA